MTSEVQAKSKSEQDEGRRASELIAWKRPERSRKARIDLQLSTRQEQPQSLLEYLLTLRQLSQTTWKDLRQLPASGSTLPHRRTSYHRDQHLRRLLHRSISLPQSRLTLSTRQDTTRRQARRRRPSSCLCTSLASLTDRTDSY